MNNKKVKNILLSGMSLTSGNLGVSALATSTIYLVNQVAKKNGWIVNFLQPSMCTRTEEVEIEGTKFCLRRVLFRRFDTLKTFIWHCLHPAFLISEWNLNKSIFLLDITGGDSYSDIYGIKRFDDSDFIKKFARVRHIPQMMLPQTIGPFEATRVKHAAKRSIEATDVVLTRDKLSYDWVLSNTIQKNVYELIDVAFFMPYTRLNFDSTKNHVGLNVSSLLWHGGYTRDNQFRLKDDYPMLIKSLLRRFLALDNVVVHLVPHVIGTDPDGVENDYWVATRLQQEFNMPNLIVAPFFFSPIEAKNYISGMNFFIGARMHTCIAAFSSGVPVVPMAYSRKFNGLFVETLNYPYMVDMKLDDNETAVNKILNAFERREELRSAIKRQDEWLIGRKDLILQCIESFLNK